MTQVAPKQWWRVYNGEKECRLFMALSRGVEEWRSTNGLAKTTKIAAVDVEVICAQYVPLGIINQHPTQPNTWRYWERSAMRR